MSSPLEMDDELRRLASSEHGLGGTAGSDSETQHSGSSASVRSPLRGSVSQSRVDISERVIQHIVKSSETNTHGHASLRGKRNESAPDLRTSTEADLPRITVGVCAMDKKAKSKQMQAITERLMRYGEFNIIVFGDDTILNKPVEDWPVVQCLLSWHSKDFPLAKAQAYVKLRRPYLINDVFAQDILLDRRRVYQRLTEAGIPVPHHIVVDRDGLSDGQSDPDGFMEGEDFVELNGVRINKPFVEKPASGEDHNVYIYYPHSMGGGVKKLFRKVDNKSGDYDPNHPGNVRREGSFIYEEFLTTGGTDVKVYTVGPRYAHAEARKSPVVDGKVQRTAEGKEVRYPVLLSPQEKEIARSVSLAFGQRVCGFDLLRSERGRSYVCDVNGWSFVKNSQKYYDDAAGILRVTILSAVAPHRLMFAWEHGAFHHSCNDDEEETPIAETTMEDGSGNAYQSYDDLTVPAGQGENKPGLRPGEELRCVLAVVRHGDRTPKQKMKLVITQKPLLDLLDKYIDSKGKQAKLKSPKELQELLDVTRTVLQEMGETEHEAEKETKEKLRIMKTVLEQGGQFAGINRKVQLKPLKRAADNDSTSPVVEALLILKHGGVLTHAGRQQAEALGSLFRNLMYPQSGPTGGGLLRLHSTYRHDLKIYSSDEGRVQTSAAAFAKGLLDLEGTSLTPILVSLVNKDAGMLDAFGKGASVDINAAKAELYAQMTYNKDTMESEYKAPEYSLRLQTPQPSPSIDTLSIDEREACLGIPGTFEEETESSPMGASDIPGRPHIYPMPEDPLRSMATLRDLTNAVVDQLRQKCLADTELKQQKEGYSALTMKHDQLDRRPDKPCGGEKILLVYDRWRKLAKAFWSEKKGFDISKVPDIYDAAKYDSVHNAGLQLDGLEELYHLARTLANAVIPNEYGLQPLMKLRIGSTICANLLGKLLSDLASMRDESMVTAGIQHKDSASRSEFAAGLMDAMEAISEDVSQSDESELHGGEDDAGDDDSTMHRLCPTYAQDVNSPLRHVRTRIYFTSESHCHALTNVLRYCHLGIPASDEPLLTESGESFLHSTPELDYMTHIVLRMFENKSLPLRDPRRFRVEILFSPGAAHSPYEVVPIRADHIIPVVPRMPMGFVTLSELEKSTKPLSKPFKRDVAPYHSALRKSTAATPVAAPGFFGSLAQTMSDDLQKDQKPIGARKKRKSPVVDDGSPIDRRIEHSNNNVGTCQSGAVLGVPIKLIQSGDVMDRRGDQGEDRAEHERKTVNNPTESVKPGEDGENRGRLVWSQELHNRFLNALSHLGLKRAVPKGILGLMEVDGMTRENIASHLQKYRLFLKKMGGFSSKDKISVEKLQELHEENIRRMATHEAMQEAALSVDESDSNAAVVDQPKLRNVVEGIPITGSMSMEMDPDDLRREQELLDPRNLQYPAVGLPPLGQVVEYPAHTQGVMHADGLHTPGVHHRRYRDDLELRGFDDKEAKAVAAVVAVKEDEVYQDEHEPLLIETTIKKDSNDRSDD